MATFNKLARQRSASPAARRKAVTTLKRNLAHMKRVKREAAANDKAIINVLNRHAGGGVGGAGKTVTFNVGDLPSKRPPQAKRKYLTRQPVSYHPSDRAQLAREVVTLLTLILK